MAITYKKGNIAEQTGIILHGVNDGDAMGAGVAKALYEAHPAVKTMYHAFEKLEGIKPELGMFQGVNCGLHKQNDTLIFNMWTQSGYGGDNGVYATTDAIRKCLGGVFELLANFDCEGVNMPKIGAGRGGLSWTDDVAPIVEEFSLQYDIPVTVWVFEDEYATG